MLLAVDGLSSLPEQQMVKMSKRNYKNPIILSKTLQTKFGVLNAKVSESKIRKIQYQYGLFGFFFFPK